MLREDSNHNIIMERCSLENLPAARDLQATSFLSLFLASRAFRDKNFSMHASMFIFASYAVGLDGSVESQ